jgi:hypothetical protein
MGNYIYAQKESVENIAMLTFPTTHVIRIKNKHARLEKNIHLLQSQLAFKERKINRNKNFEEAFFKKSKELNDSMNLNTNLQSALFEKSKELDNFICTNANILETLSRKTKKQCYLENMNAKLLVALADKSEELRITHEKLLISTLHNNLKNQGEATSGF